VALPKVNRLRRRQDFQAVYKRGIRRKAPNLTLYGLRANAGGKRDGGFPPSLAGGKTDLKSEATEGNKPRLKSSALGTNATLIGISISQKVSKKATVRNRIKRQIRAAARSLLPRLKPGWLLVVVVGQKAPECDYAQLLGQLEQLLVEAEVLNGN